MSDGNGGRHAPAMCGRGVLRRRREPAGSDGRLWREPSGISSATHRTHNQGAQLQQPNIQSERRRRKNKHSGAVSTTTAMPTLPRSLSPAYLDRIGNVGHNPLLQPRLLVLPKLETGVVRAESRRVSIINKYLKQRLDTQHRCRFATRLDSSHRRNSTSSPTRTRPRSTYQ
jgi:hypothetical protein